MSTDEAVKEAEQLLCELEPGSLVLDLRTLQFSRTVAGALEALGFTVEQEPLSPILTIHQKVSVVKTLATKLAKQVAGQLGTGALVIEVPNHGFSYAVAKALEDMGHTVEHHPFRPLLTINQKTLF